jgi:hypothetical protein
MATVTQGAVKDLDGLLVFYGFYDFFVLLRG